MELTPFFINYRKNVNRFLILRKGLNTQRALVEFKDIKSIHEEIVKTIKKTNKKVIRRINI